jgi:hypothetical protein
MSTSLYPRCASKVQHVNTEFVPIHAMKAKGTVVNFSTTHKWTEFIVCKRSVVKANISIGDKAHRLLLSCNRPAWWKCPVWPIIGKEKSAKFSGWAPTFPEVVAKPEVVLIERIKSLSCSQQVIASLPIPKASQGKKRKSSEADGRLLFCALR